MKVQRGLGGCLMALVLAASASAASAPARPSAPAAVARPAAQTVLVMGDSLSAGYGLRPGQGWVDLTAAAIKVRKPGWSLVNASISGETTAGGASRIEAELRRHKPGLVVIALGANDGLRGLALAQTRANLERMLRAVQTAGGRVLLVGMRLPPNFGPEYTRGFEDNYRELATRYRVPLLPFLLEPIATDRDAFQDDNLHPVASVQPKLRDHVWTALAPLLR